ncbi:hypothetical protein [Stieleria sp.]|uniref:hypothetical protein n=1 Tax=Stieleria sp. TaxID=2795976 RepID=UPI003563C377
MHFDDILDQPALLLVGSVPVEASNSPARQINLQAVQVRRFHRVGLKLNRDERGRSIAGACWTIGNGRSQLTSPLIEGGDRIALAITEICDGQTGLGEPLNVVTPLLCELRVGKLRHEFLLKAERNPSR